MKFYHENHAEETEEEIERIFFGSFSVYLEPYPGKSIVCDSEHVTLETNIEQATDAKTKYGRPFLVHAKEEKEDSFESKGCIPFVVNLIPAADPRVDPSGDVTNLPSLVQFPLIKTASGTIRAIRSGGRSSLLPLTDRDGKRMYFRLKGCGNYVDADNFRFPYPGFPIKPSPVLSVLEDISIDEDVFEVRGCAFRQTAYREQLISSILFKLCSKEGIFVGNEPVCVWEYDSFEVNVPLCDSEDEYWGSDFHPHPNHWTVREYGDSRLQKMCCVLRTRGEKRLAAHLLPGLELLLNPECGLQLSIDGEALQAAFLARNSGRISFSNAEGDPLSIPSIQPTVWTNVDSRICVMEDPIRSSIQIDFPPTSNHLVPEDYMESWNRACSVLSTHLECAQSLCSNVLGYLYWRIGWEVGNFLRVLRENDISWGYYIDHNECCPHCNSHPNNFVVLPDNEKNVILAPVDFDMAYLKEEFVSKYTGNRDLDLFKSWTDSEREAMEKALGGEMVNTGLMEFSLVEDLPFKQQLVRWALRDTLIRALQSSLNGEINNFPVADPSSGEREASLEICVRSLIRLALIATNSRQS